MTSISMRHEFRLQTTPLSMQASANQLSQWFETPLGKHLLAQELAYFDAEVSDIFGYNALQFGLPQIDFLRANRVALRACVGNEPGVRVRSDHCELPLATAELDLVVLPHLLEFSHNPHQILREVQRVLRPEGHVILSGFNPWSLWGLARLIGARSGEYPWSGQFISLPRIKDWLALLGLDVVGGRMTAYTPPWGGEKWLRRLSFMEKAGQRWWPIAGGVYFLHGIKRVSGVRLITPKWKRAPARKALAPVPQRVVEERTHARRWDCARTSVDDR
jgi:SAM-dependent methyltransferase